MSCHECPSNSELLQCDPAYKSTCKTPMGLAAAKSSSLKPYRPHKSLQCPSYDLNHPLTLSMNLYWVAVTKRRIDCYNKEPPIIDDVPVYYGNSQSKVRLGNDVDTYRL